MPQNLKIVYCVEPDKSALAERAAEFVVEKTQQAVAARGRARIAISGGSTPRATFEVLAEGGGALGKRMPWDKLDLFWVDERCVPPDHPDSNYRMTRKALLDYVPLKPDQVHRMEGELEPDEAAARYEAELRQCFKLGTTEAPQFDLIQLGMGRDGHTASLFPHTDALREIVKLVTANYVEEQDMWRVTLTWPVIEPLERGVLPGGGRGEGDDSKRGVGRAARRGAPAQSVDRPRGRYTDFASGPGGSHFAA